MVLHTKGQEETEALGETLAAGLAPDTVVALLGDLGAGKTAFVRGMAKGLGVKAPITSPTFTVVNEYKGRLPLFHFDLYRLSGEEELMEIGFDDYRQRGGVCAVEWSERAAELFARDCVRVRIERGEGDDDRVITIEDGGLDSANLGH